MNDDIISLINRRRHQILVHSAIYYEYNVNLILDHIFDSWCEELVQLTKDYSLEASLAKLSKEFKDFDGSTGAFLPYDDYRTLAKAESLLNNRKR